MLSYCLKYKKKKYISKKPKIEKIKNRKIMLSSNCAVCGSKTLRFIKEQGASGLLSNLGIKTPLR